MSDKNILTGVPCLACQNCYNCRYWRTQTWCDWILANKVCPAMFYTYESIFEAMKKQQQERAALASSYLGGWI